MHRNQTERIEHATHASCHSGISDPVPRRTVGSPSSAAGPGDQQGPSLPARASIPALPCLLGWCRQEKTTHFSLTPAGAILYASACVYATQPPLFLLGLKVFSDGRVWFGLSLLCNRDALAAWLCSHEQMSLQVFHSPRRVNRWVWLKIHLADLVFGESDRAGTASGVQAEGWQRVRGTLPKSGSPVCRARDALLP